MSNNRRRFLAYFSGIGMGSSLLPGVLWAQMPQDEAAPRVTDEMLKSALAVAGLTFSEEDRKAMLQGVNRNLTGFEEVRKLEIPNDVAPPFYFSSIVAGHESESHAGAAALQHAGGEAAGEPGRCRVLAGGAARAALEDAPGDLARVDARCISRACTNTTAS